MRILLHVCCAPCLLYPLEVLKKEGLELEGLFYNPNIHPLSEYLKRRQSLQVLSDKLDVKVTYHNYNLENFFRSVASREGKAERCPICWYIRLKETARFGRQNGFDLFTSTLLVSPYQDHSKIWEIGQKVAGEEGIDFRYQDFREGYRKSIEISKRDNLYRQKYCGCLYSEKEKYKKRVTS